MFGWLRRMFGGKSEVEAMTPSDASKLWDTAIAAAESGRRREAIAAFRRAIDMDPNYYVSVIAPSSAQARACWKQAVDEFVREKDAKIGTSQAGANLCACCGKDIGTQWHYRFESIVMASSVGGQCPECGRIVCKEDLKFGPDKNYEPCPKCGIALQVLSDGPSYSSMIESARRERRYRGAIKEPSVLGRPVKTG